MRTSDWLVLAAAFLAVLMALIVTLVTIKDRNKPYIDEVQLCKDAGGVPLFRTYILDENNKRHVPCLNPSVFIDYNE